MGDGNNKEKGQYKLKQEAGTTEKTTGKSCERLGKLYSCF